MKKRILIMGLPGSGKSYLSKILAPLVAGVWLNADEVRKKVDDWDFSLEGRLRQAHRMRDLADSLLNSGKNVIADFICPTKETREIYSPDFLIFMKTIDSGRYEDTNRIFSSPERIDFLVTEKNAELMAFQIAEQIERYRWNNQEPTSQMLGRYQPWHEGHKKLFEEAIKINGQVNIMVKDVQGIDDNPFDYETIKREISESLKAYGERVKITLAPNIMDICYGRTVGYSIRQIELDSRTQEISATQIRRKMRARGEL